MLSPVGDWCEIGACCARLVPAARDAEPGGGPARVGKVVGVVIGAATVVAEAVTGVAEPSPVATASSAAKGH